MATGRKAQFFEKSLQLIHHRGFKGTTMRDIAHEMNCDVANLYNFVRSKQDILDQTLFRINDEFHEGIDRIIESQYPPIEKLRLITRLYVQLTFEKPLEISLLVNGWRHLADNRKEEFLAERASYEAKVRSIIEEGILKGDMKELDPALATNIVLSAMRWLFDKCVDNTVSINPIEVERQINAFLMDGISAVKP